jgi:phage tail-like protein
MATATRNDPYSNFNFRVEIDGIPEGSFSECSGMCSETEVIHYREGGQFGVRVLPAQTNYSAITLKRGVTADLSLWNWCRRPLKDVPIAAAA